MFPIAVATDDSRNMVYVLNYGDSTISEVDATSISTLATIPTIRYPGSFAVNPLSDKVYVGSVLNLRSIEVMDGATNDVSYIHEDCGPAYAIAVNPVTGMVYVTTSFGGFGGSPFGCVLVIDGSTDTVVQTILLGRQAYPGALTIDTKSNTIYVADSVKPLIYVIDGRTNTQTGVISLNLPYVSSMAIDTSASKLLASHSYVNAVSVMDLTTGSILNEIPLPGALVSVGVDPMTHMIYVTDYEGELAIIQG